MSVEKKNVPISRIGFTFDSKLNPAAQREGKDRGGADLSIYPPMMLERVAGDSEATEDKEPVFMPVWATGLPATVVPFGSDGKDWAEYLRWTAGYLTGMASDTERQNFYRCYGVESDGVSLDECWEKFSAVPLWYYAIDGNGRGLALAKSVGPDFMIPCDVLDAKPSAAKMAGILFAKNVEQLDGKTLSLAERALQLHELWKEGLLGCGTVDDAKENIRNRNLIPGFGRLNLAGTFERAIGLCHLLDAKKLWPDRFKTLADWTDPDKGFGKSFNQTSLIGGIDGAKNVRSVDKYVRPTAEQVIAAAIALVHRKANGGKSTVKTAESAGTKTVNTAGTVESAVGENVQNSAENGTILAITPAFTLESVVAWFSTLPASEQKAVLERLTTLQAAASKVTKKAAGNTK